MKYMPPLLADEIRKKAALVRTTAVPEAKLQCRNLMEKVIEMNARQNSFRIEVPPGSTNSFLPSSARKNGNGKKFVEESIENLENAFEWGRKNFNPPNFDDSLLLGIAGRVTPDLYIGENARYRHLHEGTSIIGARVIPPYPQKLTEKEMPHFIESLRKKLQYRGTLNRIHAAIYTHLHLARMHPFIDGNGRTARLTQDVILDHYNIPLPVIESGERNTYYNMIDRAVYDYKHKKQSGEVTHGATEGEADFYTFMAGKINMSLDRIVKCIKDFR